MEARAKRQSLSRNVKVQAKMSKIKTKFGPKRQSGPKHQSVKGRFGPLGPFSPFGPFRSFRGQNMSWSLLALLLPSH